MKLATRLNSFINKGGSIIEALNKLAEIEEIRYVDLNYPEHFKNHSFKEIKECLIKNNLKVNGLALRFKEPFIDGELGHKNKKIANEAKDLCKKAIDITKKLNGTQITIWLGYDGFDYSFQINYANVWNQLVDYFREIADYADNIEVSIEYKPYEPRSYSILPDAGTTLLMINDIDRRNVGITLDFCHMLMKGENPAYGLNLSSDRNKLYGVHLNDGHGLQDDGLIIGSVNFIKTLEFIYYMKLSKYNKVIYFDTFPVRENPLEECKTNIRMLHKYNDLIDKIGMNKIKEIINSNNAIKAQDIFLKL